MNGGAGRLGAKYMKEIALTQGKVALVDDEDFDELNKNKWFAQKNYNTFYAARHEKKRIIDGRRNLIFMHRVIVNTPIGMQTDHINGNGLDNCKENLRICTKEENARNKAIHRRNTSGYKGVTWNKFNKKWMAQIRIGRKNIYLGYFIDKEKAHQAYCESARNLFKI